MIEINKNPKAKELSQFGIIWLPALLLLLVWMITSRLETRLWTILLSVMAIVSMGLGVLRPLILKPVFVGLQYLTWPIGMVVSYVLLAIVFYLLITPLGLLLRLFGYDPVDKRMRIGSMWHVREPVIEQASYFRQF
jgi:Saxitoxin biosynthesis operon protein SxtJ